MSSLMAWLSSSADLFLRYGVWGLFSVAFAEASFFPVPPDLLLLPLALLNPRLALWYAFVCTAASVAGGVFGHYLGSRAGRPLLNRLFSARAIERVDALFSRYGGWAVGIAAFTPIPFKVFTIAAGAFGLDRGTVIVASIIGRGGRFFLEAALIMALGQSGLAFISRNFELITCALAVAALIVWYLSQRTPVFAVVGAWLAARVEEARAVYRRRFQPLGAYGYYLATGLGLAGTSLVLFTKLATELLERELDAFDVRVLNAVRPLGGAGARAALEALSLLGSDMLLLAAAALLVAGLLRSRRAWEASAVAAAVGGAWALNTFLQGLFRRPPPPGLTGAEGAGFSFPSQHSLLAFAFYGICFYLCRRLVDRPALRFAGSALAVAAGLLVGCSRVGLGLDYPSDVLAGYAAGGFWVAMCVLGLETARYLQGQRR